ncbi:hypothetical protein [Tautonia plasticadhaerens]|uniref:Uncharacterized protein n=1 Tax=Tautonia plasticadhaerens TaxID=2527974 RepID=A0A518H1Z7_9BACT|nr:hypothetical protein [Tautonia plasticadhaerens]QDV34869.1 hypothetical protein ElP_27660 [Tautonia plasticadhaerens]
MENHLLPEPLDPDKLEMLRRIAEAVRQVHADPRHGDVKPKNVTWEGEPDAEPEDSPKSDWETFRDQLASGERQRRVYRPGPFELEPRYPERRPGEFEPPSDGFEPYAEWTPGED